jgi:UDP-N-acetylmuramyl pentapeptide phosphotransferase/UDP-N-acetylglucosamine-1-phosphate transferase
VIDRPDGDRKVHRIPIAYLGGAAVFTGILAAIVASELLFYLDQGRAESEQLLSLYPRTSYAVVFGMLAIFITGVLDDMFHWDPRLKLAGQFVAAAGLAMTDFGTNAVSGLLAPIVSWTGLSQHLHPGITPDQPVQVWDWWTNAAVVWRGAEFAPWMTVEGVYYWLGVCFIAAVVLGAANSANLIDGLDGLLTGSVAIMAAGFITIAVILAIVDARESVQERSIGIEIVERFVNEDWSDERTIGLLDFPTPVVRDGSTTFERDGRVNIEDLRAVLGDPEAGEARQHAMPNEELQAELGIVLGPDDVWKPGFRGKDRLLAAFDPKRPEFNLVDVEQVLDIFRRDRQGVIDQADFRVWVERAGILTEPRDPLAGARLIIAFALLGACLGFLPYNFNPAVIFLGDAGSLLMGFLCGAFILSLGSEGQTHYVIAGLIVFALPILDTVLAIIRRKLAGLPLSAPDRNHIHHLTLRFFGGVKRAVVALYALDTVFVVLGVGLVATVASGVARYLLVYGVATIFFGMVGTMAIKAALRQRWMAQLQASHPDSAAPAAPADSD